MNEFINGFLVGFGIVTMLLVLIMLNKANTEILALKSHMIATTAMLIRIDKTSQATMAASEGFIDGLRQSAEQLSGPSELPPHMRNPHDQFRDLRNKFEEGINRLENEEDDDDEDEPNGLKEDWKK